MHTNRNYIRIITINWQYIRTWANCSDMDLVLPLTVCSSTSASWAGLSGGGAGLTAGTGEGLGEGSALASFTWIKCLNSNLIHKNICEILISNAAKCHKWLSLLEILLIFNQIDSTVQSCKNTIKSSSEWSTWNFRMYKKSMRLPSNFKVTEKELKFLANFYISMNITM